MRHLVLSNKVAQFLNTQIDTTWKWRTRDNTLIAPAQMRTGHIFNTLRMIWNNKLPDYMRVGDVRLYKFNSFYTDEYMAQAIIHLYDELLTRNNVTVEQQRQLAEMHRKMEQYKSLKLEFK